MDKEAEFKALCEDVKKCTICHKVKFSPHLEKSDFLSHKNFSDKSNAHDKLYVNKWNIDYNCDYKKSDIMIIGQDYGAFTDNKSPTDQKLKKLISDELKINIDDTEHRLFLTNIANCYRQKKSTGKFNKGCLSICAHKFMGRLIEIISPKAIIVLGQDTFEALAFCNRAELICTNTSSDNKNNSFCTIIEKFGYKLVFENGLAIPVFPVYHPGSNSQLNRKYAEQSTDWKNIREYLKKENLL